MVRLFLFLGLMLLAVTAGADVTYVASLVPTPSSGSTGSGEGQLVLNSAETEIQFNISYTGLTGPEVAAHIHHADGSIAHILPAGTPKSGVWPNLGLLDVLALQAEQLYILIHTQANPGGELRGNILQPLPLQGKTWGAIKALFE